MLVLGYPARQRISSRDDHAASVAITEAVGRAGGRTTVRQAVDQLVAERRVLVSGGRFAFTIPHPCFEAPHATWVDADDGASRRLIGDYLVEGFWRSANPDAVRRAGNEHRTLSHYLTALIEERFTLEIVAEPAVDQRIAAEQPCRAGLPPFLLVRARRDY
jgi:hypothetical protein